GAAAVGISLACEGGILAATAARLDLAHVPVRAADGAGGAARARGLTLPHHSGTRRATGPGAFTRRHPPRSKKTTTSASTCDGRHFLPSTRGSAMAYFKLKIPKETNTYGFDYHSHFTGILPIRGR